MEDGILTEVLQGIGRQIPVTLFCQAAWYQQKMEILTEEKVSKKEKVLIPE